MTTEECLAILKDVARPYPDRIKAASRLKCIVVVRKDKPNLSEAEFKALINYMPRNALVELEERKTWIGEHGLTGESKVFKSTYRVNFGRMTQEFYVKGFFFDEGDLKGVLIQSFRRKIFNRNITLVRR